MVFKFLGIGSTAGYGKRKRPANVEEEHTSLHESDEEMFAELDSTVFKRFFYYTSPYKRALITATLSVIGFTIANLSIPLLVKFGIDNSDRINSALRHSGGYVFAASTTRHVLF